MTLYSYVVKYDRGFAPNPYGGYCTLACCKPGLRRRARRGDWVVGLAPKARGSGIVYAMCVDEVLTFAEYWKDKRFTCKKPSFGGELILRVGDNIYEPLAPKKFKQHPSLHSNGVFENEENKTHDLNGKHVLIATTFNYWGSSPYPLPSGLEALCVGRGHRSRFATEVKEAFLRFIAECPSGIVANPDSGEMCGIEPGRCTPKVGARIKC